MPTSSRRSTCLQSSARTTFGWRQACGKRTALATSTATSRPRACARSGSTRRRGALGFSSRRAARATNRVDRLGLPDAGLLPERSNPGCLVRGGASLRSGGSPVAYEVVAASGEVATDRTVLARERRGKERSAPWPLRQLAKRAGGRPEMFPEQRGEVALARTPDLQRDLCKAQIFAGQQPHRLSEAASNDVLMRGDPGRQFEAAAEREWIQAEGRGDVVPSEFGVEVLIYEPDSLSEYLASWYRVARRSILIRVPWPIS